MPMKSIFYDELGPLLGAGTPVHLKLELLGSEAGMGADMFHATTEAYRAFFGT